MKTKQQAEAWSRWSFVALCVYTSGALLFAFGIAGSAIDIIGSIIQLAATMLIAYNSFYAIEPDEIGVVLWFGKPIYQVEAGLLLAVFPLTVRRETRLVIEEQYPSAAEHKVSDTISIVHGVSVHPSTDPLDSRLTTNVSIICSYCITDLVKFISSIGSKYQLRRQIRDVVVSATQVECAKQSVVRNLNRLPEINRLLKTAVDELTSSWGVEVKSVFLMNIDLGGAIEEAQRSISISRINMEVNRNNAHKRIYDGMADAEVERLFKIAKADGLNEIAKRLGITNKEALYQVDALASMWRRNNADVNLFGSGLGDMFKTILELGGQNGQKKL